MIKHLTRRSHAFVDLKTSDQYHAESDDRNGGENREDEKIKNGNIFVPINSLKKGGDQVIKQKSHKKSDDKNKINGKRGNEPKSQKLGRQLNTDSNLKSVPKESASVKVDHFSSDLRPHCSSDYAPTFPLFDSEPSPSECLNNLVKFETFIGDVLDKASETDQSHVDKKKIVMIETKTSDKNSRGNENRKGKIREPLKFGSAKQISVEEGKGEIVVKESTEPVTQLEGSRLTMEPAMKVTIQPSMDPKVHPKANPTINIFSNKGSKKNKKKVIKKIVSLRTGNIDLLGSNENRFCDVGTELQYKTPNKKTKKQTTMVLPSHEQIYCEILTTSPSGGGDKKNQQKSNTSIKCETETKKFSSKNGFEHLPSFENSKNDSTEEFVSFQHNDFVSNKLNSKSRNCDFVTSFNPINESHDSLQKELNFAPESPSTQFNTLFINDFGSKSPFKPSSKEGLNSDTFAEKEMNELDSKSKLFTSLDSDIFPVDALEIEGAKIDVIEMECKEAIISEDTLSLKEVKKKEKSNLKEDQNSCKSNESLDQILGSKSSDTCKEKSDYSKVSTKTLDAKDDSCCSLYDTSSPKNLSGDKTSSQLTVNMENLTSSPYNVMSNSEMSEKVTTMMYSTPNNRSNTVLPTTSCENGALSQSNVSLNDVKKSDSVVSKLEGPKVELDEVSISKATSDDLTNLLGHKNILANETVNMIQSIESLVRQKALIESKQETSKLKNNDVHDDSEFRNILKCMVKDIILGHTRDEKNVTSPSEVSSFPDSTSECSKVKNKCHQKKGVPPNDDHQIKDQDKTESPKYGEENEQKGSFKIIHKNGESKKKENNKIKCTNGEEVHANGSSDIDAAATMIKMKLKIDDDPAIKRSKPRKKFSPVRGVPTISERIASLQLNIH